MLTSEDFKNNIENLSNGKYLNYDDAKLSFEYIMTGQANDILISSFLTSLKMIFLTSGISSDIIAAGADIMRERALKLEVSNETIDVVGTGGDGHNTFNISTATALVIAGAGVSIAKHGNYSASSKSGAADVLNELGVNIHNEISNVKRCLEDIGICFLFAPKHHSAMKFVMNVRKELHFRTIFNLLGPLSNPGFVKKQLVGVYSKDLLHPFANALKKLGSTNSWIVSSEEGMDEISTTGITFCAQLKNGFIEEFEIDPTKLGFAKASLRDLRGGNAAENARSILDLLNGVKSPFRDIVKLNSICALKATGICEDFKEAKEKICQSIDSKKALEKLNELRKITQK